MAVSQKKTIYAGMSGGVDSSLSAALLKEEGYDVVGVFIKVWSPDWMPCTWPEERRDAMRVASHLKIPFRTLDLEEEYKREVVDTMIAEYSAGRTPNPDVLCNKSVKFGGFLKWALSEGADFVATGHYAQVEERDGKFHLLRGVDPAKDQSYFLWTLGQKELSHALFPVGGFPKSVVREEALKRGIPVAEKRDSQGLCFIGHVDIKDFLSRFVESKQGEVLDTAGKSIGTHRGALLYTLGERHGFTLSNKDIEREPQYVVAKDIEKNTITVAPREQTENFARTKGALINTNWVSGKAPLGKVSASVRYHEEPVSCSIQSGSKVVFDAPVTVAPGQSIVVYRDDELLGGGVLL